MRRKKVGLLSNDWKKVTRTSRNILFITRTAILMAHSSNTDDGYAAIRDRSAGQHNALYCKRICGDFRRRGNSLVTPVIAFWRGILPPPLGPMIPFIALGNAVLVIVYGLIGKRNKYVAVVLASVIKYLVLAGAVRLVVAVPPKIAQMMQVPQLITALAGGAIAIVLSEILIRRGLSKTVVRDEVQGLATKKEGFSCQVEDGDGLRENLYS